MPNTPLFFIGPVLAVAWFALNYAFPTLAPTGIPTAIVRALVNGAILVGLWLGLSRAGVAAGKRTTVWLAIATPFLLWNALVWWLAVRGAFAAVPFAKLPNPLLPIAIFLPIIIGLVVLTRSASVASVLDAIPPSWLIGLQVYRVLGGTFLVYWALGSLTGLFALPAGIGDVITGMLALPAARAWRRRGVAWNLFGITDLAVAVTMGILTTTVFHSNTLIGTFPTVMIPAFAVPTSIILHGLSLWQLRRLQQTGERPRGAIQGTLVGAAKS
jgi:hypothetical protein